MEKKIKTAFVCTKCGAIHPRWQGQCKDCGEWNCLGEERIVQARKSSVRAVAVKPIKFKDIQDNQLIGYISGVVEFDRVLGGALLPGSVVLLAGEPGIGKSTLILQTADAYSSLGLNVLYVTGEESPGQMKKRSQRLAISGDNISIINQTELEKVLPTIEEGDYQIVIVDSIQTMATASFDSPPGTIGQIRESASRLIDAAKKNGFALFLVGHVTKEGMVAGPKVLEHMVDAVLYFEGDHRHLYRILRTVKNRFGSTLELGVFEMTASGLGEVANPSSLFLSDMDGINRSGAVVAASGEGNRPIMVEIQALVSPASYGMPQRVAGGIDNKRLALLLAILEKRAGLPMGGNDVFVSVAGGLRLNEPAIDLAILTAIVSSVRDIPVDSKMAIVGEVGLSGEVRPVGMIEQRIAEAAKLGFEKIILPGHKDNKSYENKIEQVSVMTLEQALDILF
ncbi:MAG: DNA repair protein RadA [Candidatus Zixiibacteriota bacterium]